MPTRLHSKLVALESEQTIICKMVVPAMQRITDALGNGQIYVVSGTVDLAEAARVITKLQGRFPGLTRNRKHAYRERMAGRPCYKLIAHANTAASQLQFWLMTNLPEATDGERWIDACERRPRCYQYEALRLTREGASEPAWTWQMTAEAFDQVRTIMLSQVTRQDDAGLESSIQMSRTWPGFHGIRKQRATLWATVNGHWKRVRGDSIPVPEWPRLSYVRRVRSR